MKGRNASRWNDERGIVLIVSMLVMAILSVLGLAFLMTARTEDAIAGNYRNHTAAFYAAEAGLESGVSSLKSLLGGGLPTQAQLDAIVPAPLTDASYTFDTFQIRQIRATPYGGMIDSGPYIGLNAQFTPFEVTASVTGPRGSRAQITQTVQQLQIPLFQFQFFYGKGVDLEMLPSPAAVYTGRIHANSNIYLLENTDLKIDSYMTTSGDIVRGRKEASYRKGNPQIKGADGNYYRLDFDHDDKNISADGSSWDPSDLNYWRSEALARFGGKVQDSAMGVGEIRPPIPDAAYDPANPDVSAHQLIEKSDAGDSAELKDAKINYQAGLIIEDLKAYDQAGNSVNITNCKDAKGKKAVRKETFHDQREMLDVEVTQIDVGALAACGVMPANGILYATAKEGSVNKGEGIRLVNGAELPKQGLTVASENPVYVQGDYNTVNKVPAAVMGDAIYVLSNNWGPNDSDKKGTDDFHKRPGADTTVNAAFMMGPATETDATDHNGFSENLPRFLEDWNNTKFTYNGSMVALWHSKHATGHFHRPDGKYYRNPPVRIWSYDTLFDTNPPPGTPMGIVFRRGQWSGG